MTQDLFAEPSFLAEQKALWFENRTGLLTAIPSSLSIIAPSNLFNESELNALLEQSRANLTETARLFSNGNPDLANGIGAQFNHALSLYSQNKELPLELNLGNFKIRSNCQTRADLHLHQAHLTPVPLFRPNVPTGHTHPSALCFTLRSRADAHI